MKKKLAVSRGCTYCGTCVFECPQEAVFIDADGAHIDQEKCTACGICYQNCASEAIHYISDNAADNS